LSLRRAAVCGCFGVGWVGAAACQPTAPSQTLRVPIPAAGAPAVAPPREPEPAILSAHLEAAEDPTSVVLVVVFASELDPTSVEPGAFRVMRSDGTTVLAREASLAPANEADENRTVWLVGAFGTAPTDVMVDGRVYGELGESFEGALAPIDPYDAPGRVVLAMRLSVAERRCEEFQHVVRLFWSDSVRKVDSADLAVIAVTLSDGSVVAPARLDDHDLEDQRQQDNVLDLCVAEPSPPVSVEIPEGTFCDPAGHPSAAVKVEVAEI
jgi:hypothetical protein